MNFSGKALVVGLVFAVLLCAEVVVPAVRQFPGGALRRLRHDGVNLGFGGVNALLVVLLLSAVYVQVDAWGARQGVGLLRVRPQPGWGALAVAVVILDGWMYIWHRLLHGVPVLWRFHRMHHTDPAMDASTGVRFHFVESLAGAVLRLGVVAAAGISLEQLAVYEAVSLPCILFHHSNVRLPPQLDTLGRVLFVTPRVHRIHHNELPADTHANYGTVFSLWDRVGRTLRLQTDETAIHFGLPELQDARWQTVLGMLRTPLTPRGQP